MSKEISAVLYGLEKYRRRLRQFFPLSLLVDTWKRVSQFASLDIEVDRTALVLRGNLKGVVWTCVLYFFEYSKTFFYGSFSSLSK